LFPGSCSIIKSPSDREVYVRHSTDPWVDAGVAGGLLYLLRRPVFGVLAAVLLALGISMLIVPSWTAVALGIMIGLGCRASRPLCGARR
jgi:hypothetical protein